MDDFGAPMIQQPTEIKVVEQGSNSSASTSNTIFISNRVVEATQKNVYSFYDTCTLSILKDPPLKIAIIPSATPIILYQSLNLDPIKGLWV